ncbi:MAG TPA: tetratricopeptide repeat protein [Rhizomicrobium sp.]|nr:tetratricopeptide repeat protein [Rhizomicrobium sp.]
MSTRFALSIAAFATALSWSSANAAVTVIGAGPAQLCYQGADSHQDPAEFMISCNLALAGSLSDADRAATYVNRGVLKLDLRMFNAAADDFNAGLKINASVGEGYVDLGATEIVNKRYAEAIAHINKGLSLGTKQPEDAYYDRAMADEALGNLQAAYDDYRQALALAPDFTLASDQLKRFKIVDKPSGA